MLEQYLGQLNLGLAHAKLLILDHRLGADSADDQSAFFTLPADPRCRKPFNKESVC